MYEMRICLTKPLFYILQPYVRARQFQNEQKSCLNATPVPERHGSRSAQHSLLPFAALLPSFFQLVAWALHALRQQDRAYVCRGMHSAHMPTVIHQ